MELDIVKPTKVNAETLSICMKVRDTFCADLIDDRGVVLKSQDHDYVPDFMPGEHYGDYLMLEIDIDTGQIKNWKKPTKAQLERWINGDKTDE